MLRLVFIRSFHHGMPRPNATHLKVGNVRVPVHAAKNPELVPAGFADTNVPQLFVQVIKWMMKKDLLNQDIFLIGTPGFLRSQIVFQFLELCNREFEYLPISRDTTEADVKQRREIALGSVFYSDLCAVRAALNGRVLVIDGVEKAERNVLPILNNLLENREMQLDDGRFLMAASRYDKLLEKYSVEQLRQWKLERVSPDFRIIALGLPVPTFHGHTLDPPLRSRFQSHNIAQLPYTTMTRLARAAAPLVDTQRLNNLIALVYALISQNQKIPWTVADENDVATGNIKRSKISQLQAQKTTELARLPLFPVENFLSAVRIWNNNPLYAESHVLSLCYPDTALLNIDSHKSLMREFLKKFDVPFEEKKSTYTAFIDLRRDEAVAHVKLSISDNAFPVNCGALSASIAKNLDSNFVSTTGLEALLADLFVTHSQTDFCLLGGRGVGKSAIIDEFARRLGYHVETMILYQDMNSRELVQRRRILPNGDTIWDDSQLVRAAKRGDICVLDGMERVHWSMLELLAPLIHHRFLQLPDGSRLVGEIQFETLKARTELSEKQLNERQIFKIAKSFRLIGLGDSENAKWLNDQILPLFHFHTLKPLTLEEELHITGALIPDVCKTTATKLLTLTHNLRDSRDASIRGLAASLSLRRIIFLLRRHTRNPVECLHAAVSRAALARFLPIVVRETFEAHVRDAGIFPLTESMRGKPINLGWLDQLTAQKADELATSGEQRSPYEEAMVPDVLFYDNQQHSQVMELMSEDFDLGSHLLLIGNQGVGKNKIVDRFLQLINRPRQYMQLHRDTTVQSLTVQTTVVDGVLRYEDSGLVKAVREGLVLVVDEADKAPLHVVAVLKSLLDSGVLYLSDGRTIRPPRSGEIADEKDGSNVIRLHKDFRIIMLANRPGFPFLGNDLFGILGDLFSVHVVDNPLPPSEIVMLKNYGPDVPEEVLTTLVSTFGDLREMADQSILSYPYSTRELVNIVKHLQKFPGDNIGDIIRNVFDFDAYSRDTIEIIQRIFEQRGFSLQSAEGEHGGWWGRVFGKSDDSKGGEPDRIEYERDISHFDPSKLDAPKFGKIDPKNTPHVGGNTWAGGTGGYNTAGLGGVGGPFRLDAGHDVHQLPDEAKKQVPDHILEKARKIAQQEYAKKLKEIEMGPYDAQAYGELYEKVVKQARMLKTIVDSLEAREHERQWAKHQTSGDLDDGKLIEGMTGEKNIYRRRVDQPPEADGDLARPKRVRLCFDVSGSMYRFNGLDQRLQRSMEAALLVMEAFEGKQDKIKYDIYGHSGESPSVPFVKTNNLPSNEKQKIDVLKRMLAHTQYCWSGDHTLQAIYNAIGELKKEENVDERIAIILSDANLERYGITPADLTRALNSDESVNAFLILIGSLGAQAQRIQSALSRGKAFVANDAAEIPHIMQKIFSSTIAK